MINRYSSRTHKLDESFLNKKLTNAKRYDRIAGYFCSSIMEVAGEKIELVKDKIRIICNSNLHNEDIETAIYVQKMKQEWCGYEPENKYNSPECTARLSKLYNLLKSNKLEIKVIPDEIYGLIHGKAGIITYNDNTQTTFLGSINETKSAFKLNYELIWEDNSEEAIEWVQNEFDYFWNSKYAVDLCDYIVNDFDRISRRLVLSIEDWRESAQEVIPAAAVEEPVFRKEFGLWEHQKYFIELCFKEHQTIGGARYILADQVGLGKTIQLAMSAKLMALYGDKPILIIVPKTLLTQWQDEMKDLLDMPSAVWIGNGWRDEQGYFYRAETENAIIQCPRRIGIVSQGLVSRKSLAAEKLLELSYECVIIDEAHRARRRNPNKDANIYKADPNLLLKFLNEISCKTKSMLLATATPVQINIIEAFDLLNALSEPSSANKIMGDRYSVWHKNPKGMLDIICNEKMQPDNRIQMWDIMRNPFPVKTYGVSEINSLRDKMDLKDDEVILKPEFYHNLRKSIQNNINSIYDSKKFIEYYNPYIRHIVRRTRDYLENSINPNTNEPYLKKIEVQLYGETKEDAIPLDGNMGKAYEKAKEFCLLLSSRVRSGGFMSTLILKRIGSTILAGKNTAEKMLSWTEKGRDLLYDNFDEEYDEEFDMSEIKNLTDSEINCLNELLNLLSFSPDNDPKLKKTLDILTFGIDSFDTAWKDNGCIVFTQYYDSAIFVGKFISENIKNTAIGIYAGGDKSGIFYNGEFTKHDKEFIKKLIKTYQLKILIGTDAASEGLNLQTLSTLINLDLPWNPTRLEQRKGRIQRIGQTSNIIKIFNMRYKDSVEDKVHEVLSDRLNDIYNMFGQIPDTLEDIWIDIAMNNIQKAKDLINTLPNKNPFKIKYEFKKYKTDNWEMCTCVLDKKDKISQLMKKW